MDGDDRAPVASFFVDAAIEAGRTIALSDSAVHHARVKRLEAGNVVRLVNGSGIAGVGTIRALAKSSGEAEVERVERTPRPVPVHVRVPIGDRERMLWVAEKAAELGVESWQAVMYRRSRSVSPRGEGTAFADKARARMISALEQSGGTWLPRLLPDATPDTIDVPADTMQILLDAAGQPVLSLAPTGGAVITFGPEGGLEPGERERLLQQGWRAGRLVAGTLRFETAGIAAIAVVRAAQLVQES